MHRPQLILTERQLAQSNAQPLRCSGILVTASRPRRRKAAGPGGMADADPQALTAVTMPLSCATSLQVVAWLGSPTVLH